MSLLDELILKHVKRRELMLREVPTVEGGKRKIWARPFVTVSREAGSGGRPIAKAVAKKLGFKFYDKKLIELIAKRAKKRKQLIKSLDEKERGVIDDLVHSLLNPEYIPEQTYIKNLCQVILSLARKGNCVILGRGGNFITGQYGGLHVRVAAPFLVRAGYTAQYEGYTIYEARDRVRKFDKERKQFIKQFFSKDPSNANYYDLVINTTYLSIEQARDIILATFKQKYSGWRRIK
jgi:cytidylate kinase